MDLQMNPKKARLLLTHRQVETKEEELDARDEREDCERSVDDEVNNDVETEDEETESDEREEKGDIDGCEDDDGKEFTTKCTDDDSVTDGVGIIVIDDSVVLSADGGVEVVGIAAGETEEWTIS